MLRYPPACPETKEKIGRVETSESERNCSRASCRPDRCRPSIPSPLLGKGGGDGRHGAGRAWPLHINHPGKAAGLSAEATGCPLPSIPALLTAAPGRQQPTKLKNELKNGPGSAAGDKSNQKPRGEQAALGSRALLPRRRLNSRPASSILERQGQCSQLTQH